MSNPRRPPEAVSPRPRPDLAVAATAHDLNQMLAVISGRLGLMLDMVTDPRLTGHLQAMETACRDAAVMVRRLGGEEVITEDAACDPAQEARTATLLVWPADEENREGECGIEIPQGLTAGIPGQILREVLVNLLLNAREAMGGEGGVRISGRARGGRIQVSVADEGPGVEPELAERLFEPGVSGGGRPGRGIGLAGCRRLLSRYGGSLELADTAGPGAVFVLDLPAADRASARRADPHEKAPSRRGRAGEGRIGVLVVDDESSVRDMLSEVLPELGCVVTAVADGEAAVSSFRPGAFQVAMLDQHLPGMSGVELAERLRRDDSSLVVMLMTGWGKERDTAGAAESDIDFRVRKPMEFKELQRMLVEAVRLHAGRAAVDGKES